MAKRINRAKKTMNQRSTKNSSGLCIDCGKPHQTGYLRCDDCLDIQAEIARQKRLNSYDI